jgi:hypothetical protein
MGYNDWDGDHFMTTTKCSTMAYKEAGISNPRETISMMEVHDCFSITELVTYEDLHISEPGRPFKDVMDGFYDLDGGCPARWTAVSSVSAIPSAPRACACSTRCTFSSWAGPGTPAQGPALRPDPQPGRISRP